jgi:glucokinase
MSKWVAGIDIGGTNTVVGLVNHKGLIAYRDKLKTEDYATPEELVKAICLSIKKGELQLEVRVSAIGVGAPSGNFYHGTIDHAPNLKWKGVIPLASLFVKASGIKTVVTNDANAAAMGEMKYGAAKHMRDFLYITLGTGVGSGIVANGQLIYGHLGFAGELGHVIIEKDGRICGCGRQGCVEAYCSAPAIVFTYHEISKTKQEITATEICELAKNGDKYAIETFNKTGDWLGFALANSVAHTGPEAIILFGGPTAAGNLLIDPTQNSLEKNLLYVYRNKVKILRSSLPESDSAILGAASLV